MLQRVPLGTEQPRVGGADLVVASAWLGPPTTRYSAEHGDCSPAPDALQDLNSVTCDDRVRRGTRSHRLACESMES